MATDNTEKVSPLESELTAKVAVWFAVSVVAIVILCYVWIAGLCSKKKNEDEEDEDEVRAAQRQRLIDVEKLLSLEGGEDGKQRRDHDELAAEQRDLVSKLYEAPVYSGSRRYHSRAYFCMSIKNPLRNMMIGILEWKGFDTIILVVIGSNCLFMALQTPGQGPEAQLFSDTFMAYAEAFFMVVFTVEFSIKSTALGFVIHSESYLRDPWNILDFLIVLFSWLPLIFPSMANMTAIRSVRALRPLRTISRVEEMRVLVATLVDSLPQMANVAALCGFILLVFGILGVQLFMGLLHFQCLPPDEAPQCLLLDSGNTTTFEVYTTDALGHMLLDQDATDAAIADWTEQCADWLAPEEPKFCKANSDGNPDPHFSCEDPGWTCSYVSAAPGNGENFDDIGTAFIIILECITQDGCVGAMYTMMNVAPQASLGYFIMLTLIGAFFVINLFLGVIFEAFQDAGDAEHGGLDEDDDDDAAPEPLPDEASALQKTCFQFINHSLFDKVVIFVIIINTLLMMSQHDGMSDFQNTFLVQSNLYLTAFFTFEMIFKLMGLGLARYSKDRFNLFDMFVVTISLLEIVVELLGVPLPFNVSVLRAFRLLRIFRLMRSFPSLRRMVQVMLIAMLSLGHLLLLTLLITSIFVLLGMQLFGKTIEASDDMNFTSFGWAFITVFKVLTGVWSEMYATAIEATGGLTATIYFVSLLIVGLYFILNLFIAILLETFEMLEKGDAEEAKEPGKKQMSQEEKDRDSMDAMMKGMPGCLQDRKSYSLWIFAPEGSIRQVCLMVVESQSFDRFIIVMIIVSSVCLALDSPRLEDGSTEKEVLGYANIVFTILFSVECVMKIIAFCFIMARGAYLTVGWNILDFIVVLVSVITLLAANNPSMKALKSLRCLRCLRPLRLISRNPGMKLVVECIIQAIPQSVNVCAVSFFFMLIFGILGVQFYSGSFMSCNDESITLKVNCVGNFTDADGELENRYWSNPDTANFDNIGAALLTLYEMCTLDAWEDVMALGIEAQKPGVAPQEGAHPEMSLFFMMWVFIGAFFVFNLFVGVVINTFNKIKNEHEGAALMTDSQRQWAVTLKIGMKLKALSSRAEPPDASESPCRRYFYDMVHTPVFEWSCMGIICANILFMSMESYNQSEILVSVLTCGNFFFTAVFTIEAALKIFALGVCAYFDDSWNDLDFLIVISACFDLYLTYFSGGVDLPVNPTVLRILRMLRLLRMLKLLKHAAGITKLLTTLVFSFPSLMNVGGLLCLVVFIYAVLGVQLFTFVAHGEALADYANFDTFGGACLVLFQSITGDGWVDLMHDCVKKPTPLKDSCTMDDGNGNSTCGSWVAIPYFLTFNLLACVIFLNIVIAVILDNFGDSEEGESVMTEADVEKFKDAWRTVDPMGTGKIQKDTLPVLVRRLEPPLGLGSGAPELKVINFTRQLGIDPVDDMFEIKQVYFAVTTQVFDTHVKEEEHNDLSDALRVLDASSVQSLTPKELRKAGMTVNRMKSAGFNDSEIRAVVTVLHSEKPNPQQLKDAFKVFDEDGSGLLERQEFQQVLFIALPKLPKNRINHVFQLADRDGSGQIDFEEFEWILHNMKVEGRELIARTVTLTGIKSSLSSAGRRMSSIAGSSPNQRADYQPQKKTGGPMSPNDRL